MPRSLPGDWFAVVTDGVAVLLPPETTTVLVGEVWDALRDGLAVARLPELVGDAVASCGAVSVVGGHVHLVLRGDVVVTASGPAGSSTYAGEPGTWHVPTLDLGEVEGLLLEAPGAERRGSVRLPVLAAVVPSAAVELGLTVEAPARAEEGAGPRPDDDAPAAAGAAEPGDVADAASAPGPVGPEPDDWSEPDDVDGDTILQMTPALRAQVDALAAAAADELAGPAQAGPAERVPAEPVPAAPDRDLSLDDDHLDAMTILGVDRGLRAEVDAIAAQQAAAGPPAPPAPPSQPPAPPVAASSVVEGAADHDGLTVMSSDLVEIRKNLPTWTGDRVPGPFAVPAERGPAKLVMSSGLVVTLERTVLVGRAPIVSRVPNRSLPRLVTVPSPHHDISRTHAQVQDDGDRVFVTDLHSTNGVVVHAAGAAPVRLAPGVPTLLALGATVDIGDGVTFSVVRDR